MSSSQEKKQYPDFAPYVFIRGGRVHNLKDIDVTIPHGGIVVVTGVSGSGKSSLIFDLLYAESRRRYMETLDSGYLRTFIEAMERPDVDRIDGLQSVIGIGQETAGTRTGRSTVGTLTDIYAFLRLLYARAGKAVSYLSGHVMMRQSPEQMLDRVMKDFIGQTINIMAPLVQGRKGHYKELFAKLAKQGFKEVRINGKRKKITPHMQLDRYKIHHVDVYIDTLSVKKSEEEEMKQAIAQALHYGKGVLLIQVGEKEPICFSSFLMDASTGLSYHDPSPNTFSFNSPEGACKTCQGFGTVTKAREEQLVKHPQKSILEGAIPLLGPFKDSAMFRKIEVLMKEHGHKLSTPLNHIPTKTLNKILYGQESKGSIRRYGKSGIAHMIMQRLKAKMGGKEEFVETQICSACKGDRLRKEALSFFIGDKHIAQLSKMNLKELYAWALHVEEELDARQKLIAEEPMREVRKRLELLLDMQLHYLSLDRSLQTLSGGEIRRVRLATQIGTQDSQLVGVMYILDEPSIGLHQRDNQHLIEALKKLRDAGNTVIVIEHDKDTMLVADYLIEVGPGAGKHGGEIVASGAPEAFLKHSSVTAAFLKGEKKIPVPKKRRPGSGHHLILQGCTGHNLKHITLDIPLGKLITVTGVSGSGKSSLIQKTLLPVLKAYLGQIHDRPLPYKKMKGLKYIDKVIEVDQQPIGRTPRSNPATYTNLFGLIRDIYSSLPEAKIRGYKPGRFSFNVKGGRCEGCEGAGVKLIEMNFLPSVRVLCEDCQGRHYNRATLEVQYKGKSIADILDMTIEAAIDFFVHHPRIRVRLEALQAVGLGYVTLGQHATTLSGGEAQRVKLASELNKKDTKKTLYILDEPTTGLHFQDIKHLLSVLQRLVDKGNTVIVIEHNLDVIKVADHVIDLGPEPGDEGGQIIATGTPEEVAQIARSHTGRFLKEEL